MAKYANDSVMDAALAWIRDNTTIVSLCSAQPTTAAEATATYTLGTLARGTANWTLANADGGGGGRKITAAAATITVTASGTVNHIAYTNTGTLVFVGTCAPTAVTSSGTVTIAAFDLTEIADPA